MPIEFPLDLQSKGAIENANFAELKALRFKGGLPEFSATPTYTGVNCEIVISNDGTTRQLCSFVDGVWRCIELGATLPSKIRVHLSVAFEVPTGTSKLDFDEEDWDTNNEFDVDLARFTPSKAGYYSISFKGYSDSGLASGKFMIYKNGAEYSSFRVITRGYSEAWTDQIYSDGDDYFEIYYQNLLAATQTFNHSSSGTILSIHEL